MDSFSYNNIFETKGIEYLIIIAFLILIIPFWLRINQRIAIKREIKRAMGIFSAGILRIPQGLFFSNNHTWAHLEMSGNASVGIDDFLQHVTGKVNITNLKKPGTYISKGEFLVDIARNGKTLHINAPISGKITDTNTRLINNPGVINEDPYGDGWIYKINPSDWIEETESYYLANGALAWSKKEIERLKNFISVSINKYSMGTSQVILQDGGEMCDNPLSELPGEAWLDFEDKFLKQQPEN